MGSVVANKDKFRGSVVANKDKYEWSLTYEGVPSRLNPPSIAFQFTLRTSHRVLCQNTSGTISKIIEHPQESSTLFIQLLRFVIEDPLSLELEIIKALIQFGVLNTSLWPEVIHPVIGFVHELLDNYGAASAMAMDLELSIEDTVEEDETCAICLENLSDRVGLTRTSCEHGFHTSCLTSWLLANNSCPLCRRKVFMDIVYGNEDVEYPD